MFRYFKTVVVILKFISSVIVLRNYGKITYDISNNYGGLFLTNKLRKLGKLSLKVNKANLDINFLLNCKKLSVIPKGFFQFTIYQQQRCKSFLEKITEKCSPENKS